MSRGRTETILLRKMSLPGEQASLSTSITSSRYRLALSVNPGTRAPQRYFDLFRFLRGNGGLGHAFVLHQRFELREGELQNLNCLLQLRRHHELLQQSEHVPVLLREPSVLSVLYFT